LGDCILPGLINSFGDLLCEGEYHLHSRFRSAVNFLSGDSLASVVTHCVGPGPMNIVVDGAAVVESLTICRDSILLNGISFPRSAEMRYDSRVNISKVLDTEQLRINIAVASNCLLESSSPRSLVFLLDGARDVGSESSFEREFVRRTRMGAALLFGGNAKTGTLALRGLGFGLTPSGDDFLSGVLTAYVTVARHPGIDFDEESEIIYRNGRGRNPMSNALLRCAKDGFLPEKYKTAVEAVVNHDKSSIGRPIRTLLEVGETSGADFAVGLVLGLKNVIGSKGHQKWLYAAA